MLMTATLILLLFSFGINMIRAQVVFDIEVADNKLAPVKISAGDVKYLNTDWDKVYQEQQFSIFNPDGSVYKVITIPASPSLAYGINGIYYFTNELFDQDPSTSEYLVEYSCDSSTVSGHFSYLRTRIIREDGTILLDDYYASLLQDEIGANYLSVYTIGTQTKLAFWIINPVEPESADTRVYNLPGQLPTGQVILDKPDVYSIFPNPNRGSFYLKSECNGDGNNIFEFFTLDGKSIDRISGNSVGGKTFIKTNLPNGIYLITPKKSLKLKAEKVVIQR